MRASGKEKPRGNQGGTGTRDTAGRFGFVCANTIGGTPQKNAWSDDWVEFYRDKRLRYQVELAGDGYIIIFIIFII